MNKILILAEHHGGKLNASTAKCVSCAKQIGGDIAVLVLGAGVAGVAAEAARIDGVARVVAIDDAAFAQPIAQVLAPQIAAVAAEFTHVLGPSTTFGKDVMPCVAALLGEAMVSDIMKVRDAHTFERPIYAGNAIVTVSCPATRKVVATVRAASYPAAGDGANAASVQSVAASAARPTHTRYVELKAGASDRPDLQTARRVISGGRALGSAENFAIIVKLADKLGAAVGASRAAVDAGYAASDLQVGQTGKIIAPELYVAIGISGAIQHVTGIKDAGTIVAINKDGEAPIFEIADIGLVGDLFKLIPELEAALS
jgi:electron transfer flavoprotein alpha subunit